MVDWHFDHIGPTLHVRTPELVLHLNIWKRLNIWTTLHTYIEDARPTEDGKTTKGNNKVLPARDQQRFCLVYWLLDLFMLLHLNWGFCVNNVITLTTNVSDCSDSEWCLRQSSRERYHSTMQHVFHCNKNQENEITQICNTQELPVELKSITEQCSSDRCQ